ncbi:hypothetical protein [Kitasatospora sp. NPDC057223]|uniref:hypothetical protein n=1 Tax=Kitasatospora sp. NPDC057223 TaxID=3346055 RepID=UPI0036361FB5
MATPAPARTTGVWSITAGKGGRVADSERLHEAKHEFLFDGAQGQPTKLTYDVDIRWTSNAAAANAFAVPALDDLREQVRSLILPSLSPQLCLLDPVLDCVVDLSPGWTWLPGPTVQQKFCFKEELLDQGPAGPELLHLAAHLISLRGTVEARLSLMRKLNIPEVQLITNANLPSRKSQSLAFDWGKVLVGTRLLVIKLLRERPPRALIKSPPFKEPGGSEMNALLVEKFLASDPGLQALGDAKLIDIGSTSGQSFRGQVGKGTLLTPDKSGDLQAAYNHLRFLLYMEWRAVHELLPA